MEKILDMIFDAMCIIKDREHMNNLQFLYDTLVYETDRKVMLKNFDKFNSVRCLTLSSTNDDRIYEIYSACSNI